MAYEQGEHLLRLAHRQQEPILLLEAHRALGTSLFFLGELATSWTHLESGITLYEAQQHPTLTLRYGQDPGMACLVYAAWLLWWRGYPDQALHHIGKALGLAQQCMHPFCQAFALTFAAVLHQCRRETQAVSTHVEASLSLAHKYEFPLFVAMGVVFRSWALAEHSPGDEGVEQIRQGIIAYQATGSELCRPYFLGLLAETYGNRGRIDTGLEVLTEALTLVETTGERLHEAELYRLRGKLLLQSGVQGLESESFKPQAISHKPHVAEAETCFHRALTIARNQHTRSLEFRATVSLSRLWQQLGKYDQARCLLEEIYGWFTEGFDTRDLKEAKMLLDELRRNR